MILGQLRAFMPLYTKWRSGQVLPMPYSQTLKDRATQLLTKNKSGALVTQLLRQYKALGWVGLHCHKAV